MILPARVDGRGSAVASTSPYSRWSPGRTVLVSTASQWQRRRYVDSQGWARFQGFQSWACSYDRQVFYVVLAATGAAPITTIGAPLPVGPLVPTEAAWSSSKCP